MASKKYADPVPLKLNPMDEKLYSWSNRLGNPFIMPIYIAMSAIKDSKRVATNFKDSMICL